MLRGFGFALATVGSISLIQQGHPASLHSRVLVVFFFLGWAGSWEEGPALSLDCLLLFLLWRLGLGPRSVFRAPRIGLDHAWKVVGFSEWRLQL